ncbi:hypothetical protein [Halorubrum cibi]|uniref:Uncharacterized protein n=1 Tax=Halorubrum cibi TaxID=413815 RepID=A0A521F6X7_9EURY|nr:hypothetical protein [Halorubrum cibi]SMO91361.1 hypothetical protein SAMN06264867_1202 [Halorubrum cibi]
MTFTNDELAALGVGFSAGAGVALVNAGAGLGIGLFGIGAILIAIKRDRADEPNNGSELEAMEGAR